MDESSRILTATKRTHSSSECVVEESARQRLEDKCPYAYYFRDVTFNFRQGVLTLSGSVCSFYMKQILQTFLADLESVQQINNQVDVVSSSGLSSEGQPTTRADAPLWNAAH